MLNLGILSHYSQDFHDYQDFNQKNQVNPENYGSKK